MKINKKIMIPIILSLTATVLAVTFAYFGVEIIQGNPSSTGLTVGDLDVSVSDSAINVSSLLPIYSQYVDSMAYKKEFAITNAENSLNACNKIYLNINSISNGLKSEYFKYKLIVGGKEKTGDFSGAVNGEQLLLFENLFIESNTFVNATLYIWIEYADGVDQVDMLGTSLSANVAIESVDRKNSNSCKSEEVAQGPWYESCSASSNNLNCKIITAQTPSSDENIDFAQISSATNGNGLYYTSDLTLTEDYNQDGTGDRVYYYRGAVTNNNVRFGGYCWRIVRTNEDGSVRLRYNGTYENGTCPVTGTDVKINNTTYSFYGSSDNEKYNEYIWEDETGESLAKTTIDAWYTSSGLVNYADQIANVPYCADKSNPVSIETEDFGEEEGIIPMSIISLSEYYETYYGAANRLIDIENFVAKSDAQPTYKCARVEDKHTVSGDSWGGNGKLSKPIGLLTADEVAYAGGGYYQSDGSSNNITYYLYTSDYYWLISPFAWNAYYGVAGSFRVSSTGDLINVSVVVASGLLPVVSLKAETMVNAEGTGTYTNPYVVES